MAMAMTLEEKQQFIQLQKDVHTLTEDVEEYKEKADLTDNKINKILTLVRGIAIGLAIGGGFFGLVKFPELIKFFTK